MMNTYLFTSERLGFRNWTLNDLDTLTEINNDEKVMEFFPFKPSKENTRNFILKMQQQYSDKGFCYFAVDILETNEFIGFIGLSEQTYLDDLGPFVDIGWRLHRDFWNKGYATEGANACLDFGFTTVNLDKIYSLAPEINIKSEAVMKKIGMQKIKIFQHPKLLDNNRLVNCVLYVKHN
ncbi:GNAT family N-acetyltransferase [Flavobacteriaceae bacterium (ex Bugula neritina AB1)]|nr:GNAT family N-acetyltransferase [Flavobacteriaceae bacterium (ex Bugula neritina AB1)]